MSEDRSALKIIRLPSFIYFAWKKNVEEIDPRNWLDVHDANLVAEFHAILMTLFRPASLKITFDKRQLLEYRS